MSSILLFDKLIQIIKTMVESVVVTQQQDSMTQIPVPLKEEERSKLDSRLHTERRRQR